MTKKLEKINKSTCLKLFEKKDMATMNQFLCIRNYERLSWQMSHKRMQGQSFNYKLQPNLKNLQHSNSMYVF